MCGDSIAQTSNENGVFMDIELFVLFILSQFQQALLSQQLLGWKQGLPPNCRGLFGRRNSRGTSAERQACPVWTYPEKIKPCVKLWSTYKRQVQKPETLRRRPVRPIPIRKRIRDDVIAFLGTSISVTRSESPSVPMARQAAEASVTIHEPENDAAASIIYAPARDIPTLRCPKSTRDALPPILQISAWDIPSRISPISTIISK